MALNQKEIKKQAKEIIDNFVKALEKIKIEESAVEREYTTRKEGEGQETDPSFRKIFFENDPSIKNEFIKAEKKGWEE